MKDEYCKEYWAGRLIDLDKDIAWDIAEEIIESQSTLRKDLVEKMEGEKYSNVDKEWHVGLKRMMQNYNETIDQMIKLVNE